VISRELLPVYIRQNYRAYIGNAMMTHMSQY